MTPEIGIEAYEEPGRAARTDVFAHPLIDTLQILHAVELLPMSTKQDRIITALVVATWLIKHEDAEFGAQVEEIISSFATNPDLAYMSSTNLLYQIKDKFGANPALVQQEFGITTSEKTFVFLNIKGDTNTVKYTWYKEFARLYKKLNLSDKKLKKRALFSGLGDPELGMVIVAYEKDKTRSFLYHEYLHLHYGFENIFFDEMVTEALAYADSGFVDLENYTMIERDQFEENINTDYYDSLQFFLNLCRKHAQLFPSIRQLYVDKNDSNLIKVGEIIGKDLFHQLYIMEPSKFIRPVIA